MTIAFRGTAQLNPFTTPNDLSALAEFGRIGFAASQIVAMYNWWQRVSTPAGLDVPQYFFRLDRDEVIRIADARSTGEVAQLLAAQPDARVSVTGSSMGGHLAMAFAGLFPTAISQAVAFNSPGFPLRPVVSALFADLGGTVPTAGNPLILNVVSSEANNAGDQLDILAGYPDGNFPGIRLSLPIEDQFRTDVPDWKAFSYNHDQRQVTDSLAVFQLLQRLDPSLTLERYAPLLRSAANGENRSLENLVDAVQSFFGIDRVPLPAGNAFRDALHTAIQSISGGVAAPAHAGFLALAGRLRILPADSQLAFRARDDFGAFVALQELSPVALVLKDAGDVTTRQVLDTLWQTTRSADYAAWSADRNASAGVGSQFTRQWLDDRAFLLQVIDRRNAASGGTSTIADPRYPLDRVVAFQFTELHGENTIQLLAVNPASGSPGQALSPRPQQLIVFDNDGSNRIDGTDNLLGDHLYGGQGDDTLTGLAGDDYLEGGAGQDLYGFAGQFGVDLLSDSDGRGSIQVDGQMLAGGKGSGTPNLWLGADTSGQIIRYIVRDSRESATGKQLLIARAGDPTNTITVNDLDLAAARSEAGYLGIRLDDTQALVIAQQGGAGPQNVGSPFEAWNFDPNAFTGQTLMAEGGASVYTMFLRVAAQAGDTLTLALSGLQDKFQAWIGRSAVAASGAVIVLQEGQTQVSVLLQQQGDVTGSATAALSARFTPADGDAVASNVWTLHLQDGGATGQTLVGDQQYLLRTSTDALLRDGFVAVQPGGMAFIADSQGNLAPGAGTDVVDNVLFGADGADRLQGLLGNDALDGGAGNDVLEGGGGDDLIAGGAGQNDLQGGEGNDFLLAAGRLSRNLQQLGPADNWLPPPDRTVLGRGATWGVFAQGDGLSIWDGAIDAGVGHESNRIAAGDGDDHVIAGAGDDYVLGGSGQDHLDGMGGADIIEGGEGDDTIRADGIVLAGYLNTTLPEHHGADHVDAGIGTDTVEGGGGTDLVYGGAGNDRLYGDTGGLASGVFFVPLAFHGPDALFGEDGDDYLEGGGGDDTLLGGAGADMVWGDTAAANLAGLPLSTFQRAWGDDQLGGGDGDDTLIGGGGDDTLLGGDGSDALRGDESSTALADGFHGADLLDGGAGNDLLVGGGRNDTVLGGAGDDDLQGDDALLVLAAAWHGNDYLDGGDGADRLTGGGGADVLFGGPGNDLLRGDLAGVDAGEAAFDGADHLEGEAGDDQLWGGGAADTLLGGSGNDLLDGGAGADHLEGGSGDDRYVVDQLGDQVFERADEGIDTVSSAVNITLPDHVEHLLLTGSGALDASGNDAANRLTGNDVTNLLQGLAGNDVLDGGAGADTLVGGPGDDGFEVDDPADAVVEAAGEGDDTVRSRVHYVLPDHVEHLVAAGAGPIALTGNRLDNSLTGNTGDNLLRGGAGDDFLSGGGGNDVYAFGRGDGRDTIDNTDLLRDLADALQHAARDTLLWGSGIRASEILASRSGDALLLQIQDSGDAVVVAAYFAADEARGTRVMDHRIDQLVFESDAAWDAARIAQEVARAASNRAPQAGLAVPVLRTRIGETLVHQFALGTIADPDAGDSVRYSLRQGTGAALPDWLVFDAGARILSARPGAGHAGSLQLELRGTDRYGLTLGVGITLDVTDPVQRGTNGNDTLTASALGDTLVGGPGQDILVGGVLGDTYQFATGDGQDTITETSAAVGVIDRLVFGPDIAPADIMVRRAGEDLLLAHTNGVDQVTVKEWFTAAMPWVEQIMFADQTVWTAGALTDAALVVAGTPGDDVLAGTAMNDSLRGLAGNDTLQGAGGSDVLDGGDGHDVLAAGAGANATVLLGGAGNDRLSAAASARNTVFDGGPGGDSATGSDYADTYRFRLGDGQDWITEPGTPTQTGAQDVLEFGPGIAPADIRVWRYGNDLYFSHSNGSDQVAVEGWFASTANFSATARRIETIRFDDGSSWSAADLTAAALVVHGTEARDFLTGSDMNDSLYGLGGDDRLSGGRGQNLLDGGAGNDVLVADDGRLQVVSFAGMFPIVRDYWASNWLRGGAGDDTLMAAALARDTTHEGGAGNDSMIGSAYNDSYLFGLGDGQDTITEVAPVAGFVDVLRFGPGILPSDIRVARVDGSLQLAHANGRDQVTVAGWFAGTGQHIETIVFDNGTVWNEGAVAAALPLVLTGTSSADVLVGTTGADEILGLAGNDMLGGGAGPDRLLGGAGNDRLDGGDGNDLLEGDAPGEAAMAELLTSLVVHARGTACEGVWPVMELWFSGTRVASISVESSSWMAYTVALPAAISTHSIDVVFPNDAYRPDLGQDRNLWVDRIEVNGRTVSASGAGTVLDYGAGAAAFDGRNTTSGSGVLHSVAGLRIGLQGGDQLDGGAGSDTLVGGIGNDLYLVDNPTDVIRESAGAGHDIVRATVSYALADHLEDLELGGTQALHGIGNALGNTLRGNAAANRLDGGAGADMLVGGAGDDTYVVDHPGDYVYEVAGGGIDTLESLVSFVLAPETEHLTLTGSAATHATGNALSNRLVGNAASNTLSGGAGDDSLQAGAGNDTLLGGAGNDLLFGDADGETLAPQPITGLVIHARGTPCDDVWPLMEVWLAGVRVQTFTVATPVLTAYTVSLPPGTQAQSVDLVFTNDALRTDLGQDRNLFIDRIEVNGRTLAASGAGAVVDFGSGAGAFDNFNTAIGYGVLGSHGALRIGLGGNDHLDGGAGADILQGGMGNDLYLVDDAADVVFEQAVAGHDTVRATISHVLAPNLEDLELSGAMAYSGTGNNGMNTLRGTAWANRLDGAGGADMLVGGAGDDIYVVDNAGDRVYEVAGRGDDLVQSSVGFVLGAEVEHLTLVGDAPVDGTGNDLPNTLRGNAAANTLSGGAGNDTLVAGAGNDRLLGGDGSDVLWGDEAGETVSDEPVDSLVVFARGSVCEGLWPTMEVWLSGVRMQSFSVQSASFTAYTVTVAPGTRASAVDIVFTNDAYRPDIGQDRNLYVDRIEVNGRSLSASGTGSVLDFGSGAGAFDFYNTALGSGVLASHGALHVGLRSNDWMDGGTGADTMVGGTGADVYLVDHLADTVIEEPGGGHDIVRATVSHMLAANLEDLELVGSLAIDAVGNGQGNTLRGNAAANRLDGGAGADLLVGGAGSDTYVLARGAGVDGVYEYDPTPGHADLALFGTDIASDQLWFRRRANNLEVGVIGTADRLSISGWYLDDAYKVEQFRAGDGRVLLDSQVHNLVNAMAAFAPPPLGQTSLSAGYREQLAPVLAANWQ